MSVPGSGGRLRVVRGPFCPRGLRWESLALGSTNALWLGRGEGGDWLCKWYRYPQVGVHPEAEVAEFLHRQGVCGVAGFGARVDRETAEGRMTVGLIQRWVEGVSGWEKVLDGFRGGAADAALARRWGKSVGELHRALASGEGGSEFGEEPLGVADLQAWSWRVERLGERLWERLEGVPPEGVTPAAWARARLLWVDREEEWRARARALAGCRVFGCKSRIHGDLHLGQVLDCGVGGAVVVDFEGEPLRALEERRLKESPLRDVAGMWRSWAYAGVVGGGAREAVCRMQESFLEGWQESMDLPGGDWRGFLEGLIWEKAIYEVLYEIQQRPHWLEVPLAAL